MVFPETQRVIHIKIFMMVYVTDDFFRNEINNIRFPRRYAGFTMDEEKLCLSIKKTMF